MKKKVVSLLCMLLCAALLALPALAAGTVTDPPERVIGRQDRTVYAAGEDVDVDAEVAGAILAAGYNVHMGGTGEYVMIAGYSAVIEGQASRDVFAAGYSAALTGGAARDVFLAGNDVSVSGEVGRNLYVAGSRVVLSGHVAGDVYISAQTILLGGDIVVDGTLHYNDSANVTTMDNSNIAATEIYETEDADESAAPARRSSGVWDAACAYLGAVALAFVLLWLTPLWERIDERYTAQPFGKYASAFGIGFGVLAGLPIAAIVLMITGIGLRLAFVLLLLYVAAILAAPLFLGFILGGLLWRKLLKKAPNYWAELPLGLLAWRIAAAVPVLSFVTGLVAVPLGLGMLALLLGKGKKSAPAPVNPALPPEDFGSFQG